jgi:OTU domain-containing protein 6
MADEPSKEAIPKNETKGQMTQRHKREVKELQNKIGGLNRTVSKNDKEGRKRLQQEIKKLEDDQKTRHENEIKTFETRQKEQESQVQTGVQNLSLNNNTEENNTEEKAPEGENATESKNTDADAQDADTEEPEEANEDGFTINIPGNKNNNSKVSRAKKRKAAKVAQDKERQQKIEDAKKNTVSQRDIEIQRLKEILAPMKLVIREISADGNCLYNAVADQLRRLNRGDFFNNEYLRNQVADYMMANKHDFLPFMDVSEGEFENYCNKIRTTAAWGGQLEIQALTNILKVPIEIYSATSPVVRMGDDFTEENPVLLSYHKHMYTMGEHYNSIVENTTVEF